MDAFAVQTSASPQPAVAGIASAAVITPVTQPGRRELRAGQAAGHQIK